VVGGLLALRQRLAWGGVEELVSALEVAADSNATLNTDLVRREHLLGLVNAHVLVCHGHLFF